MHRGWNMEKKLRTKAHNFLILAFSSNFCPIKTDLSGNNVDRKLQIFKNSPKWTIFGIFNLFLSIQNVSIARFARIVKWDFFCDFQTACTYLLFLAWEFCSNLFEHPV